MPKSTTDTGDFTWIDTGSGTVPTVPTIPTTAPCANAIITMFPEPNDLDVYYRTQVRFGLAAEDPDAKITVFAPDGTTAPGASVVSGPHILWVGEPLLPQTTYTVELEYECGIAQGTWTTSATGSPLQEDVVGDVFASVPASGQWTEPPGVGDLLASQLGDTQLLLSPTALDGALEGLLAIGAEGSQDLCSPTWPIAAGSWEEPFFSIQTPRVVLDIAGFEVPIEEVTLSGAFAPDGSRIQGITLQGITDTRPMVEGFGLGTAPNTVCDLVATFGVACEPCPDGSGAYCLPLMVDDLDAPLLPGVTLVERLGADIEVDPLCE